MPHYPLQRYLKPTDTLTDEECDVQQALSKYTHDPQAGLNSFVPTKVLYDTYWRHIGSLVHCAPDRLALSPRQFGAALQRIYPFEKEGPEPFRVQRRIQGVQYWGYIGLLGPGCIETRSASGLDW